MEESKLNKVIEDLGTAIMCVNNMLTQEQFIVRDKVVNAMIEAIKLLEEQKQQIEDEKEYYSIAGIPLFNGE